MIGLACTMKTSSCWAAHSTSWGTPKRDSMSRERSIARRIAAGRSTSVFATLGTTHADGVRAPDTSDSPRPSTASIRHMSIRTTGLGREDHTGGCRRDHLHHDHRHGCIFVRHVERSTIGGWCWMPERCPHAADSRHDRLGVGAVDVQKRLVLAGKRGPVEVFDSGRRTNRYSVAVADPTRERT